MKMTEDAETATLTTLFQVERKGSRFLVTGLIRVVFTDASYSGRVCSPSSKWLGKKLHQMNMQLSRSPEPGSLVKHNRFKQGQTDISRNHIPTIIIY